MQGKGTTPATSLFMWALAMIAFVVVFHLIGFRVIATVGKAV